MSALAAPDNTPNPAFSIDNDGNAALAQGDLRLAKGFATSGVQRTIELRGARPTNGSPFARLLFSNYDNDGAAQNEVVARIAAFNGDSTDSGDLRFHTSPSGNASLAERMRIREDGKVGVGTAAPDARLDVEDSRCCNEDGGPDRFIANVVNTSTNTGGPDVLWLETAGVSDPGSNAYFIAFMDANGRVGSVRGNGSGGVQFTTTGADYAEELEHLDATEVIAAGDVVGVFGGKISKRTEGSDWVTVVSGNSAFVGNVGDSSETGGQSRHGRLHGPGPGQGLRSGRGQRLHRRLGAGGRNSHRGPARPDAGRSVAAGRRPGVGGLERAGREADQYDHRPARG